MNVRELAALVSPLVGPRVDTERLARVALELAGDPARAAAHNHETIPKNGAPYVKRYFLTPPREPRRAFLHEFLQHDTEAHRHDHPYDNWSVPFAGGFDEEVEDGSIVEIRPGDVVERRAERCHRIVRILPGTRTLFVVGPRRRAWGFDVDGTWIEADLYLRTRRAA